MFAGMAPIVRIGAGGVAACLLPAGSLVVLCALYMLVQRALARIKVRDHGRLLSALETTGLSARETTALRRSRTRKRGFGRSMAHSAGPAPIGRRLSDVARSNYASVLPCASAPACTASASCYDVEHDAACPDLAV